MVIETLLVGGDNFSYVIYDNKSGDAALIDPSMDPTKAIEFIRVNKLNLQYIINTHHHRDHTASNQTVKSTLGGIVIASKPDASHIQGGVDNEVGDGEILLLGNVRMEFLITPGHTRGGLCIIVDDQYLLTGDTLFIGDCGRTDFPGGSDELMFETIQRLKALPDELIVYPGHHYGPKPYDTLSNQKLTNKVMLAPDLESFKKIP